ncbi:MAG: PD40 domain-containing protein [Flammeovirgaceae bacterium]|nr:PD40 domain-containing protein [Flammeovirgaceae bacterium]
MAMTINRMFQPMVRKSKRYYYSAYDHAINPMWSNDGKEIYFVSNQK